MSLYTLLCDPNILYESFLQCKKSVGWKESVQRAQLNVLKNINVKRKMLLTRNYWQRPFHEFSILERGKERYIRSLHINDRMIQRAVCDFVIIPEISQYLIFDNGASIKGKGIDFSRNRLHQHIWNYYCNYGPEGYILLIDFRKYFDNIDHNKLMQAYSRIIKDQDVFELVDYLIRTFAIDLSYLSDEQYEQYKTEIFDSMTFEPWHERTGEKLLYKSLGMGSQISQASAVYYPTPIDNYCKIVEGCKYYGRYMDDSYIIHHDKEFLKYMIGKIAELCSELKIYMNPKKTQIQKLNHFSYLKVNYHLTETGKIVKMAARDTVTRERHKLRAFRFLLDSEQMSMFDIIEQYKTWRGMICKFDSYHTVKRMDEFFRSIYNIDIKDYIKNK